MRFDSSGRQDRLVELEQCEVGWVRLGLVSWVMETKSYSSGPAWWPVKRDGCTGRSVCNHIDNLSIDRIFEPPLVFVSIFSQVVYGDEWMKFSECRR